MTRTATATPVKTTAKGGQMARGKTPKAPKRTDVFADRALGDAKRLTSLADYLIDLANHSGVIVAPDLIAGRFKKIGLFALENLVKTLASLDAEHQAEAKANGEVAPMKILDSARLRAWGEGIKEAIGAWKPREYIDPKAYTDLPSSIALSAARTRNETRRTYEYLHSYFILGKPPGSNSLGTDAAMEIHARPWTFDGEPYFAIDIQIALGIDLERVATYLATQDLAKEALWRRLVVEPIKAYQNISVKFLRFSSYDEAMRRGEYFDILAHIGGLDLICIGVENILKLATEGELNKRSEPPVKHPVRAEPRKKKMETLRWKFPEILTGSGYAPKVLLHLMNHESPPGGWSINNLATAMAGTHQRKSGKAQQSQDKEKDSHSAGRVSGSTRGSISAALQDLLSRRLVENIGEIYQLGPAALEEGP